MRNVFSSRLKEQRTKNCPQCGRNYGDAARFCTRDGRTLVAASVEAAGSAPQTAPAPAMACPQCGQVYAPPTRFCTKDGRPLVMTNVDQAGAEPSIRLQHSEAAQAPGHAIPKRIVPAKRARGLRLILFGLFALALVWLAGHFWFAWSLASRGRQAMASLKIEDARNPAVIAQVQKIAQDSATQVLAAQLRDKLIQLDSASDHPVFFRPASSGAALPPTVPVAAPPTAGQSRIQVFQNPTAGGLALDVCESFARNCRQPAADAFCRQQRFDHASGFARTPNSKEMSTRTLSGQICPAGHGCGAFTSITCAGTGGTAVSATAPPPRR